MKLALLISLVPIVSFSMDRMDALSMIESGNDDRVVGRAGEISRYQVLKTEWRSVTSSRAYRDPAIAKAVALKLAEQRVEKFQAIHKRAPSDFEFYVLWNAPNQALSKRVTRTVAERARRYANLCTWDSGAVAGVRTQTRQAAVL